MTVGVLSAILLPLLGTVIGSGFVFFLKGKMNRTLQRSLTGFAGGFLILLGVVAASLFQLEKPKKEQK